MHVHVVSTRILAVALSCVGGNAVADAKSAPGQRVVVAIPAGRLDAALRHLATQTGQQILFDPATIGRRKTGSIRGPIDPENALKTLLAGSGLVAKHVRDGVIIIVAASSARPPEDSGSTSAPPSEIVVTALRHPNLIRDAEISIDAVAGTQLQARDAYDLRSAAALLPGLVQIATAPFQQRIAIRGVTGPGESTVGVYFGETPISGPSGTTFDPAASTPDVDLVDIERIELLRGPQGTLYGASSLGGTLRVLFNRADVARWTGQVDAGLSVLEGGGSGSNVVAVVNAPILRDELAARVVVHRRKVGGYVDNNRLGLRNIGGIVRQGVRIGAAWVPSSALRLDGLALHQDTRTDDASFWYPDLGSYRNDQPVRTPNREQLDLLNLTAHWTSGSVELLASGSFYRWKIQRETDFTQLIASQINSEASCQRYAMLMASVPCTAVQRAAYQGYLQTRLPSILYHPFEVESATAEIRLSSIKPGPLRWTVGGFADRRRDSAQSNTVRADATTGLRVEPLDFTGLRLIDSALDQQALFAETTWAITRRFSGTFGIRYFRYDRSASGSVPIPNIITGTGAIADERYARTDEGTSLKAELAYRLPSETLIYVIAAQGFRPGGVNITPDLTAGQRSYGADRVWSYELGGKTRLANGLLDLEGSIYHIDWSNTIVQARSTNGAFGYNVNLGSVRINGLEAKASLALGTVRLTASGSYVDARLGEDQSIATTDGQGRRGDRLPNLPQLTYTLGLQTSPLRVGGALVNFGLDAVGATSAPTAFNDRSIYYEVTPTRFLIDANSSMQFAHWRVGLSMRNVLNAVGANRLTSSAYGERQLYSSAPRSLTVSLARNF